METQHFLCDVQTASRVTQADFILKETKPFNLYSGIESIDLKCDEFRKQMLFQITILFYGFFRCNYKVFQRNEFKQIKMYFAINTQIEG
jgi:hypothetical protein